ncbi:MAG: rod shape-determining protein MreD [Minwuia sp.]|uniref:rod shape-determining protein MreD n=1 Tax=Minwuia sp. TaxID=2493630 RepID=UPI003A83A898
MSEGRLHPAQLLLALPGVLTLLLVLMETVPIGAPLLGPVLPSLTLISVFVWSTQRPDLMPHWLAFSIGLIQDLVIGGPLGLNALLLLVIQGVCTSQRRFLAAGRPFLLVWLGFAIVALPAALAQWIIACIYFTAVLPITDSLIQAALNVALFPVAAAPLMFLAQRLARGLPA